MSFKRALIAAFAVLSLVAVWDMLRTGPGAFGSIFDQTAGQIEWNQVPDPLRSPDYEATRSLEPLAPSGKVSFVSSHGRLELLRSESQELRAEYTVRAWGRGDVQAFADQVKVGWVRDDGGTRLEVVRPQSLPRGIDHVRIDVRAAVPDGVEISVRHGGDVIIDGVGGPIALDHTAGSLTVRRVRSALDVASRLSEVSIAEVEGPVTVRHSGGALTVRDIDGGVTGEQRFGEVRVSDVAGDVTMDVSQGASHFESVGGDLKVRGGYGELRVSDVSGAVELDYMMGSAYVYGITRAAKLSIQFGELNVRLAGDGGWVVDAVAQMGDVTSTFDLRREQNGPRTILSGVIGDGAHRLDVEVSQGSARISR